MKVLVFDIDGTLTQTTRVDGDYFKRAVRGVLPEAELESFHGFTEFTDTAILRDICSSVPGCDYGSVEVAVHDHFVSGLKNALLSQPDAFRPTPGARTVFQSVSSAGWIPAVATGGWRASAELKLDAAGIPMDGVPLATSSEEVRRVDIIRRALRGVAPEASITDVVYVGDGTWDVKACRELGIGFIGRATDEARVRLADEGAGVIVDDFSDPEELVGLLSAPEMLKTLAGRRAEP